ncbi:MAG: hypothetical protein WC935_09075, partial [Thermoleophilia bacterium]
MAELDPNFLNAAASQICLDGANGVNLDQLLPLSGLSKQSFHSLFPDGRSMFLAVIENIALLQERQLQRELEGVGEPIERFVRSITSDLSFA